MLYVFHGSDRARVAMRAQATACELRAAPAGIATMALEGGRGDMASLEMLVSARGLFQERCLVTIKGFCDAPDERAALLTLLPLLATSENIFILVERALDAEFKRVVTQHARAVEEYKQSEQRPSFNIFSLSDSLFARDKKGLWVQYVRALRAGHAPEALHGTLVWAVKAMYLASGASSAMESGQTPYAYGNAKRGAAHYTAEELRVHSRTLVVMYHEAHRGRVNLDIALERWILSM